MREVPTLQRLCSTVGECAVRVVLVMSVIEFCLDLRYWVHGIRTILESLLFMVPGLEWNVTRPDPMAIVAAKRTPMFHLLRDAGGATWRFQVLNDDTADLR